MESNIWFDRQNKDYIKDLLDNNLLESIDYNYSAKLIKGKPERIELIIKLRNPNIDGMTMEELKAEIDKRILLEKLRPVTESDDMLGYEDDENDFDEEYEYNSWLEDYEAIEDSDDDWDDDLFEHEGDDEDE